MYLSGPTKRIEAHINILGNVQVLGGLLVHGITYVFRHHQVTCL